jgi:hypothetical protein
VADQVSPQVQLAEAVSHFYDNPLGFVLFAYPWDKPGLLQHSDGPDMWQKDFLVRLGQEVKSRRFDGIHAVPPIRMLTVSGHGVGKGTLMAWVVNWILATRPNSRGTVTASSWPQLSTKTWSALCNWMRMSITAPWFEVSSDRIWRKGAKESWFASAQSCRPENAESFAGQHASTATSFYVFDEASAIDDKIFSISEGGLLTGEPMAFMTGNPTRNSGRFYRAAFGEDRHRWIRFSVDSRNCKYTNKAEIAAWVEQHGEDSDWIRVKVRGEAPLQAFSQFISQESVATCRKYRAESYQHMPVILGVDVARHGDDRSVVFLRQGRFSGILGIYHGLDTVQVAEKVIEHIEAVTPQAVVCDCDGLGVGTFDALKHRGYGSKLFEFHGGGKPNEPAAYANRRAETWGLMRDALKAGMQLPDTSDMEVDLCGTEYFYTPKGQIQLEPKDAMKSRGLASPDLADALSMTFAVRVAAPYRPVVNTPRPCYPGERSQTWMG